MPKIVRKAATIPEKGNSDSPFGSALETEITPFGEEEDHFGLLADGDGLGLRQGIMTDAIDGLSPVAMRLLQAATDMKQSPDSYERATCARPDPPLYFQSNTQRRATRW